MSQKAELRKILRARRRAIDDKENKDRLIASRLLELAAYKACDLILFYAALPDEINIDACIVQALAAGKEVALPVCEDLNGTMHYYFITSLADLCHGSFGIREPDVKKCAKVHDFTASLCVVPAIAYDKRGYRLGYGKGYYDRFLQKAISLSVGLCYNELLEERLPTDVYDMPVDCVLSETGICFHKEEGYGQS